VLSFQLKFTNFASDCSLDLEPSNSDGLFATKVSELVRLGESAGPGGIDAADSGHRVTWPVQWREYHVHDSGSSSPMRKTASVDDNRYLRSDGSNLSAFLYLLQER